MKSNIKIDRDQKEILIIGANGFLGSNILQLRKSNEFRALNYKFLAADIENSNIPIDVTFYHINIINPQDTLKKIEIISPDIILLTAAMTNVDQNEIDKKLATTINTQCPKNVLEACKKTDSKLVFMSTDFVFDGISKEGNYNENDIPNPLSYYAKTKYDAEQAIINSEVDYLICRTAVLYGWNPNKLNFITWLLDRLQKNEKLTIVTNQINNPTYVKNLSEIIINMIEKNSKGIYHTAGNGALSRYEMALKCTEIFNFNKNLITPINNIEQKALRPENAGLNISKLKRLLGSKLHVYSLEDGLKDMKNNRI